MAKNPQYSLDTNTGIRTDLLTGEKKQVSSPTTPVNPTDLQPSTPPILPPVKPTTTPDTTLPDITTMANDGKTSQDNAITDYLKTLTEQGNIEGKQAGYVTDLGGDKALQDYTKYKNELTSEQNSLDRKIRALSGQGLTQEQVRSSSEALTRESTQYQADLAIKGNAAKGDYDTALTIAKNKVESELAPVKAQLEAKKFYIEQKSGLWNAQQMAEANRVVKAEERAYDEEKARKENISKMIVGAISQGASSSLTQKAIDLQNKGATQEEIAKTLGIYAGDALDTRYKQAQINKIYADIEKDKAVNTTVKTTEGEKASAGYANRLELSNKILNKFENTMKDMSWAQFKLVSSNSSLANKLLTPEQQQAGQAMRNFITAKLRKESGAAISPTEFEEARLQYFPQYGDSDEVLLQKKNGRELAYEGEKKSAGGAYTPLSDETLNSIGLNDNPFKQSLLGGGSIFNQSTGQWNVPIQ